MAKKKEAVTKTEVEDSKSTVEAKLQAEIHRLEEDNKALLNQINVERKQAELNLQEKLADRTVALIIANILISGLTFIIGLFVYSIF